MKKLIIVIVLLIALVIKGQAQSIETFMGYQIPVDSAELFALGLISTNDNESILTILENSNSIIFDRIPNDFNDWSNYPIYIIKNINGEWTMPELTEFLGKPWYLNYPNPKEETEIYFAWWLPLNGKGEMENINIYKTEYKDSVWRNPVKLPYPVNTEYVDTWPSVADNSNLYFFSNRPSGIGQADIYRSVLENGEYKSVENLGEIINSNGWEHDPCIAPDESFLIYSSNMEGSMGKDDLFISFQYEKGKWSKPINLGDKINSSASDNRPYLTSDEKFLFFTSDRQGDVDIYWISTSFIDELKKENRIGRYIGQNTPDLLPEVFLPGFINKDTIGAFCSVFSPNMQEFYFVRLNTDGSSPGVLSFMKKENGVWSEIDTLNFTSGIEHDNDMCISHDGNKMFFRSFRSLPDGTKPKGHTYLWYAEKTIDEWSKAKPLYCGGELVISGYPSISKSGTLYFRSKKGGVNGIYKSRLINGEYASLELEYVVNDTVVTEGDMFIAPDESYMIISCYNHPDNLFSKQGDLYIVFKNDKGIWSRAINLGDVINTECTENCPTVTPDGKYLFFNRYCEKTNEGNIYWVDAEIIKKLKSNSN